LTAVVAKFARPALTKQPRRSLLLAAFDLARHALQRMSQARGLTLEAHLA
jgi:hypothetical protein